MPVDDCWNQIGVEGDRSCPQLERVLHCLNCPVYAAAGRSLLDREVSIDYLQEWTQTLAQPIDAIAQIIKQDSLKIGQAGETISVMIFRLGQEQFALPVAVLQEITRPCTIHTLPHRSNELLLGLVNIRGEILLCANLRQLLGIDEAIDSTDRLHLQRMIVAGDSDNRWVFSVDEVHCVYRFHLRELQETPVVVAKASKAYTQGIIDWHQKNVNYLDANRLLDALDRLL